MLQELGEKLLVARSATEALKCLLKNDVAVILIDVCMPDLDGFALAGMIRDHPRFQATAIMFVSAVAMTDLDRVKGYEFGAVDYVPVPVVPELLRAKVRVFVELYRKTRQLREFNEELERRVEERTTELAHANAELERRVEERTSEREVALAQVHEMQKLESLGKLTGGLAHDFNNLLMTILNNLDLLSKRMPQNGDLQRLLDGATQSAEKGAALTERLLAFARRQELKPEAVDVPLLVGNMVDMLQRSLGPGIDIRLDFQNRLSPVLVDPNQLELALLNLALNARDAMPQGGHLKFSARLETIDGAAQALAPGPYVSLTVTDTGVGMDEVILQRATEPFFTTKETGKGTGLGLSMVHGLAGQSGGSMRITSKPTIGTSVELLLPAIENAGEAQTTSNVAPIVDLIRPRCVLVVDDDAMVLECIVTMLEDLGHKTLAAKSGALALDVICSNADIDLLLTDHAMPGMTGVELARQARRIRENLPIILGTGFADLPSSEDLRLPRLSKPYRQAALARMLSKVLEHGGVSDVA
jgi:signal transduction histidine kinase